MLKRFRWRKFYRSSHHGRPGTPVGPCLNLGLNLWKWLTNKPQRR